MAQPVMELGAADMAEPPAFLPAVRSVAYRGSTYSAAVVPAKAPNLPPVVLLPPIGVGIDRTFCGRLVDAWAADASAGPALHAIDVLGMGDSSPKPRMKRPFGGWDEPPRTPREWAEQVVAYVQDEVGEPCVVVGQSNLCTVALEAAAMGNGSVMGVVLVGPPAIEALSIDKPLTAIDKIWRIVSSPIGAVLFRFARRKAFLESFSRRNLFANPSEVDEAYLLMCEAGAADTSTRHAIFSFVAGTWRQDYRPLLASLALPTLVVTGSDVGATAADGAGVGRAPAPPKPAPTEVDKTSFGGLLSWFKIWRRDPEGKSTAGRFDQVGRDLSLDPEMKLRDYVSAMPAAEATGCIETALLPGWNVVVYESPTELASCMSDFVQRRFGS